MANNIDFAWATNDVITESRLDKMVADIVGPYLDERVFNDNNALKFGTGEDVTILYNGTDLVIDLAAVGSGDMLVQNGRIETQDSEGVAFGTGNDATIFYDGTNLIIRPQDVGSGDLLIDDPVTVFINETANGDMTVGLTINQGANDDQALALKSSDVSHPMTGEVETDTFGEFKKVAAADGGLMITGLSDTSEVKALFLRAKAGTVDTTDTTASDAAAVVRGEKTDGGTGVTALGATENLFAVQNSSTTHFLIKGNGDLHGSDTTISALDAFDDAALLRAMELRRPEGVIRDEYDDAVPYSEADLLKTGIYTSEGEGKLVSFGKLAALQNGAIWQLAKRISQLEARIS